MKCDKHNIEKKCLTGRNAHASSWYCPLCDAVQIGIIDLDKKDAEISKLKADVAELVEAFEKVLTVSDRATELYIAGWKLINQHKENT